MDKSVDSIGTCSLDVEASAEIADHSEDSSIRTLRSVSLVTPSPEPHLPSYLSLACTVNGYSTTTNYDPERLSKSRDASPHRPHEHDQHQSHLTPASKLYSLHNNLLSPPNLVPLPINKTTKNMADHTVTHHHQQILTSTKTIKFTSHESRSYSKNIYSTDSVDATIENGIYNGSSKIKFTTNGQSKFTESTIQEFINGRESKSFIQQRIERLYGPGALAQGFFVMKRQKSKLSESDNCPHSDHSQTDEVHSVSMCDKLLQEQTESSVMKQSASSPSLPVLRHLRPEFRAQLPIVKPRKSGDGIVMKSSTVPKIADEVNGHPKVADVSKLPSENGSASKKDNGFAEKEPGIKDGHYFLEICAKETTRLLKLADVTEAESEGEDLSEDVKGKLRSAYGKARLLVSQKIEQFKGLCANNINQSKDEQFPTTSEDLQGFWDMVMLQVHEVNSLFEEIDELRKNNWQVVETDKTNGKTNGTKKVRKPASAVRPTTAASEKLRKQRDAQRKQMMEDRRKAMKAQKQDKEGIEIFVPETS